MLCQYSSCGLVSSEKDETAAEAGVEEDKGNVGSILPATVVVGGYRRLPKPTEVLSRAAQAAKALRSMMPAKLYSCDTLLEGLRQHLEDMAAELGQLIQEERAVVSQRHLTRRRHLPPPINLHIRDGVLGGTQQVGVTNAVWSPVRPATRWMCVVARAPARVIAGRIMASRWARSWGRSHAVGTSAISSFIW
jgi:hypothetical protein